MSLTRQEVFQALADGKEVEIASTYSGKYQPLDSFSNFLNLHYLNFNKFTWRIKPEPLEWYENIPEQGILCWYGDNYHNLPTDSKCITIITRYFSGDGKPFMSISGFRHENCIPLTSEEIKQFLQGE
jgi:hypothetical protein